jgi:TctA family transporter
MLTKHLDLTYLIVWSLTLAQVIGAIICLGCSRWLAQVSRIRPEILLPVIIALAFVAAFEGEHDWGDLYSLLFFGVVGWIMKRLGWPRPPMALTSLLALPIQENFEASNRAPVSPSSGSNAAPRLVAPITVPSLGAAE